MRLRTVVGGVLSAALGSGLHAQVTRSGNPVIQGWYADPEAHVFRGRYWIYPTYSAPYNQQVFDAFYPRIARRDYESRCRAEPDPRHASRAVNRVRHEHQFCIVP